MKSLILTVNINDSVKVELTQKGFTVLRQYYADLGQYLPSGFLAEQVSQLDSVQEFQLWEIMMIFGPHIYLGADNLFKDNEIGFYE